MIRDSVFDFVGQRFEKERSLISRSTIAKEMGRLEKEAVDRMANVLNSQTAKILENADRDIDQGNIAAIASIDWSVAPELQRILFELWGKAWQLGQKHGIESQQKAIPPTVKRAANDRGAFSKYAALDPVTEADVRNVLGMQPIGFEGTAYQRALLRRSVDLSGSFSKDILTRLVGDLLASVTPQPETGVPISRPELLARIQATANVTKARAVAIARTETTNVYNQARLETYQRSNLATHVRFLAISDDRTTDICLSRNGMVIPVSDSAAIAENTPPLHVNCRSQLSPLLPAVSPSHEKMANDPARNPTARTLAPLPNNWRGGS